MSEIKKNTYKKDPIIALDYAKLQEEKNVMKDIQVFL